MVFVVVVVLVVVVVVVLVVLVVVVVVWLGPTVVLACVWLGLCTSTGTGTGTAVSGPKTSMAEAAAPPCGTRSAATTTTRQCSRAGNVLTVTSHMANGRACGH